MEENKQIKSENKKFFCYILKNNYEVHKNRTYNGFTNNPSRRLRQHNQEIKGGARYTKKYGNKSWEIYVLITGFPDKINALQCEWRIKHPENKKRTGKKYCTPEGRIKGLNNVLKLEKWTSCSTINNSTLRLEIWIKKEFAHLLDLSDRIKINIVDEIPIQ